VPSCAERTLRPLCACGPALAPLQSSNRDITLMLLLSQITKPSLLKLIIPNRDRVWGRGCLETLLERSLLRQDAAADIAVRRSADSPSTHSATLGGDRGCR
jgi:hypothetical protein